MNGSLVLCRTLKWTALTLALLIIILVGLLGAVDLGYGHPLLIRFVAWRLHRPIQVQGNLDARLFSLNPQISAEHITIGNPPWTPPGVTAEIGKLSIAFKLPGLHHNAGITELTMQTATLTLFRDAAGKANWQLIDPAHRRVNRNSPIVRSLSMRDAHVVLDDAKRHLQFIGTVTAMNPPGADPAQPLRIEGNGQLNGRAATFKVMADPLATASHNTPYHFTFSERSSGSQLEGSGELPEPFVYEIIDAKFVAAGVDLKDLYFLTGVHLIDTGAYHLSGRVSRRGVHTTFSDLVTSSGVSDVTGTVATDSSSGRPVLNLDLHSKLLRLSDLGIRAAGRSTTPKSPFLLSDAMISPNVIHAAGAGIQFHAQRVEIGRLAFDAVSLQGHIGQGVLTVAPLLANVSGGRVAIRVSLDGTKPVPSAKVDMRLTDLHVGQLPRKDSGPAAADGLLQAQVEVTGVGRSIHQIAATANGTLTAQMPQGELRDSFAEMSGVDLRGLGLLLTKNKKTVPVRCAIAHFTAHDGTLTVQDLLADTEPVMIVGEGQIHLDSEALDLNIRGTPKGVRLLRLRAPVLIQGTLAHPSLHLQLAHSQFMLADRGPKQNADCAALLNSNRLSLAQSPTLP